MNTAYIELTTRCNLRCKDCFNNSGEDKRPEHSPQKWLAAIDHFRCMGIERFILSGGEPLFYAGLHPLLKHIADTPGTAYTLITNGTIHLPDLFTLYESSNNLDLQISLDGASEETNAKTRGPGVFDKTVAFLDKLRHPSKKPRLKMTVSQLNACDVEPFFYLALQYNAIPDYAFVRGQGRAAGRWADMALSVQDKISVISLIGRLNRSSGVEAVLPLSETKCPLTDPAAPLSLYIRVDGAILPCQLMSGNALVLGNAFRPDWEDFDKRRHELAGLAQAREILDFGCTSCFLRSACNRGCLAEAILQCGDPLGNDGQCDYRRSQYLMMIRNGR